MKEDNKSTKEETNSIVQDAINKISSTYFVLYSALKWIFMPKMGQANPKHLGLQGFEAPHPPLLQCIRERRSVFPRSYINAEVSKETVENLLKAAMWAPYHGPVPPWRFVVLGKDAMRKMQQMSLQFYEANWKQTERFKHKTEEEFTKWRNRTEQEIEGRWGPVSYMVGIVVQRQAGSKRMAMWEEEAATSCAVQNMHLQASSYHGLACYWSSWHSAARDSKEMQQFLGMGEEDKCLGFFMVAACDPMNLSSKRGRDPEKHLSVEWRN